ncbi:MAG: aminopeptidase N [Desulfuromonas sp.]|nr:aminopeptidase N [Desulfuromonas sp.]
MAHQTTYLKDYRAPSYLIERMDLHFDLAPTATRVECLSTVRRAATADSAAPLVLRGEDMQLLEVQLDGVALDAENYVLDSSTLTLNQLPEQFVLRIVTEINPAANSALEGLYLSSGNFCTQCEPEGFRHITYAQDRPDVMSLYSTTIVADAAQFPVLLSNGNLLESRELDDGRHLARWEDPFPKPSYLFALVAGKLVVKEDSFTTCSGREVLLQIYVEARNQDKTAHAMQSLKKAMAWDEQRFGFEYDLDRYMIVAVDDFNMGAMENKGLNVFNSKYVLASPESATDEDYLGIEGVIGHEYFHNWTGNRITCRDWFQISLKEGLTVFRDQEFSADMNSAVVKRIEEVRLLQSHQFAEDSGPLSHPVRPDSYVEINNFYTMTVYNKGAEVIRMLQTLLGREQFLAGIRCYVERHDGQAVTIDDFVAAMQHASGVDLDQFKRWYVQRGTPVLRVSSSYTAASRQLTLSCTQSYAAAQGEQEPLALLIPIRFALIGADGAAVPLRLADGTELGDETVLQLNAKQQVFTFHDVPACTIVSVLRDFSAPVKLEMPQSVADLAFLMAHDTDLFNRWNSAQRLGVQLMLELIAALQSGAELHLNRDYIAAVKLVLQDEDSDPALLALALTLPLENYIAELMVKIDPQAIHSAREFIRTTLATVLRSDFLACYRRCQQHIADITDGAEQFNPATVGLRALKNLCLSYLGVLPEEEMQVMAQQQYQRSGNMTDVSAALTVLVNTPSERTQQALSDFYQRWQNDPLVVDKWLTIQARAQHSGCLTQVQQLLTSPAFDIKNPNKVRSLIGAFCQGNLAQFHASDGSGYKFLQQQVAQLDSFNAQIAARLVTPLLRWARYDEQRSAAMRAVLEQLLAEPKISADLYEVVSKSLK